jgi:hypothetical protein
LDSPNVKKSLSKGLDISLAILLFLRPLDGTGTLRVEEG